MKYSSKDFNLGNSKIEGYIVHGYLKKKTDRTNILFGNLYFKRYFVVNFDMAQIIIFNNKPDNVLIFDISEVRIIKFSSIESVYQTKRI